MTNEELQKDCGKFIDYLHDNGVRTLAFVLYAEDAYIKGGNAEMVYEMALSLMASELGLKLVPK